MSDERLYSDDCGNVAYRIRGEAAEVLKTNAHFIAVSEQEDLVMQQDAYADGKVERTYRDGRCETIYPTGTVKLVLPTGVQTVFFGNGDIKQTIPDRRVIYYYADAQTTHVSEPDGTQLYSFPNGQVERHYGDGFKEIRFVDGLTKVIPPGKTQAGAP